MSLPLDTSHSSAGDKTPITTESQEQPFPKWFEHACGTVDKKTPLGGPGPSLRIMHAVFTNTIRMWDNGTTLTVGFVTPAGTTKQQNKVKTVVKEWEKYANIKFDFSPTKTPVIRVAFKLNIGSWSFLGTENKEIPAKDPTMNLGWIEEGEKITENDKGVILHEFGHVLGLLHEHQSPRRDEKLTLKEHAVIEYYTHTQHWTAKEVREQILDVYNLQDVSNFSAVDVTSIMMYFMPAEMNTQHIEIPPNNKLSPTDIAFVTLNYPFFKAAYVVPEWNIDHALDVAGVKDAVYRKRILEAYGTGDWSELRGILTQHSINARLNHTSGGKY